MNRFVTIIDFSHLYHVSRHRAAGLSQYDYIDSLLYHFEGKLRTLRQGLAKHGIIEYDVVFAEDRIATRKLAIFPTYRENHCVDLSAEKNELKKRLKEKNADYFFCSAEGEEADDVMATVTRLATESGKMVSICTGDRDIWQLMGQVVTIFNPIKKDLVTLDDVREAFQVMPSHIPLVKSFWGDQGDCIPNVMPRMQKYLLPIIKKSDGTLDHCHSLITNTDTDLPIRCLELYREQEPNVRRNYSLVKLNANCELNWD